VSPVPAAALLASLAVLALAAGRPWVVAAIAAGLLVTCLRAPRARRFVYLAGTFVSSVSLFVLSPFLSQEGSHVIWEGPRVPVLGLLDVTSEAGPDRFIGNFTYNPRWGPENGALELEFHPVAPRPFDLDIHEIPERPGEPAHFHLDVRYLLVGRGEPCDGAAWYQLGEAGDESVGRLAAKALRLGSPARG